MSPSCVSALNIWKGTVHQMRKSRNGQLHWINGCHPHALQTHSIWFAERTQRTQATWQCLHAQHYCQQQEKNFMHNKGTSCMVEQQIPCSVWQISFGSLVWTQQSLAHMLRFPQSGSGTWWNGNSPRGTGLRTGEFDKEDIQEAIPFAMRRLHSPGELCNCDTSGMGSGDRLNLDSNGLYNSKTSL